jgi:hypothetical protein
LFLLDGFRMIFDIGRVSQRVNIWGGSLNIPQFIGSLIFITYIEGQLVLVTVIFTLIVAGQIHKRSPFSRLIGLCHIPWLPLLPWLVYRIMNFPHPIWLEVWLYYTAGAIAISLMFDTRDIYLYSKGQTTFAWASRDGE